MKSNRTIVLIFNLKTGIIAVSFYRNKGISSGYKGVISMAKMLSLDDLINSEEREEEKNELEGLYDLVIPPGTPTSIIFDMVEEFDLEPVDREIMVNIVDSDKRKLVALRGKLEIIQEAEKYLYDELDAWVNSDY